jgi:predicted GIY-YIG superfamily endonuclease
MPPKRNWTRYILRNKGEIVYFGITSRDYPEYRIQQHKDEGKKFTSHEIIKPIVTEEGARKWEKERINAYRKSHGKPPRYNKG